MTSPERVPIGQNVTILLPRDASGVENEAVRIFAQRLEQRAGCTTRISVDPNETGSDGSLLVVMGNLQCPRTIADGAEAEPPCQPEGYRLLTDACGVAIVRGADSRGVLYGLGRLLRLIDFDGRPSVPITSEVSWPVGKERGVYFATHFNNWYEAAPLTEIERYVEDLALWGVNTLFTWFDMNWFPADFWKRPDSRGTLMIERIRRINETARRLGMTVGLTGCANEGFSNQPPPELRADASAQRGGFYPYSQICPSKPGGLEMILENRRKVLELVGPVDAYWYWPYDQGGCGCKDCADEHGWGATFLRIGPDVARVVREFNPDVRFIVSTWLMNDYEMELTCAQASRPDRWFDGLLVETRRAGQLEAPTGMPISVFPDISMFDCFFVSYGCNGANPAPRRFAEEARRVARSGCGAVVYSEGVYEDVNKVIWAALMWDPDRTPESATGEYSRFYFGSRNAEIARDLLLDLEKTWGVSKLPTTRLETTEKLLATARSMGDSVPHVDWCRWRWEALRDRAELDHLMVKVGPNDALLRETKRVFDEVGYSDDPVALREHVVGLRDRVAKRVSDVDALFLAYADYLTRFHLDLSVLVFRPDQFLGKVDFQRLLEACDYALQAPDDAAMRAELVKGIHRWMWFNGVEIDFLFL
jgi:hypothetical protein